jgi:hypothetical protein
VVHENETLEDMPHPKESGAVASETEGTTTVEDIENHILHTTANEDTEHAGPVSIKKDPEPTPPMAASELGKVTVAREDGLVSIPITCAICLETYKQGEMIVLSGNSSCTHGFHHECILDYLVRYEKEGAPCPCCRQAFMPIENTKKRGGWKKSDS